MKLHLWVVLAACSGKASEPAPSPSPPVKAAPADPWKGSAEVPPPKPPSTIVVDSNGAEPRKALTYQLPAYQRSFVYRTDSTLDGKPGTAAELSVAWACKAGGACSYQLEKFELPGMPPDPAFATIATATKGEVTVKSDGTMLVQPTTFMKTTPSLVELLKLSVVRFPAEPLGVGATWHLADDDEKRAFTLKAITATGFTVAVDITYLAEPATAHATLRFDQGEPIARTLELAQESTLDLGGSPTKIGMAVTIRSRPE